MTSIRLDQYLAAHYPDFSRSTWQKYIELGYVFVNNEPARISKQNISKEDVVTTQIPEKADHSKSELPIIYEDENVIVINKPVGVLSHSKGALNDEFTVADFFAARSSYNTDTNRPGIIHRLDRDTSGVMIGVKNDATAHLLQQQFQNRKVKKTYFAVLDGIPKEPEAVVDLPIGRNPNKPSTFRVDGNGKSAQTYYQVENSVGKKSLVRLEPRTGRTHQLRVHMAHLGTPILGDKVYGKPASRLFLHANTLEITIPTSRREVFEAPVPPTFKEELER